MSMYISDVGARACLEPFPFYGHRTMAEVIDAAAAVRGWSAKEDAIVIEWRKCGLTIASIARHLGRSRAAVAMRAVRLGRRAA